ncbi:MAG: class D beta-lactamase [Pseudomonadota bacterium]
MITFSFGGLGLFLLCGTLLFSAAGRAENTGLVATPTGCTLIVSYPDGAILRQEGDCTQRRAPASTFKLPLAVMGFDSALLQDAHTPSIDYKDDYQSDMDIQKKTTDPTIWLKESIVWYSQDLTRKMGMTAFQTYVRAFHYGNMDVTGNPGQNDGLTQSWLMSSLQISPQEQVAFVKNLLDCNLNVRLDACNAAMAITPEFQAGDWRVFGKTGSGWLKDDQGRIDKTKPQGWFIGWATKGEKTVIFAKLLLENHPSKRYAGPKAKDAFLEDLSHMD